MTLLNPIIDSLRRNDYEILKININAYTSVEGTDEINKKLQLSRANVIEDVVKKQISDTIKISKHVNSNWPFFLYQIKFEKKLKDLKEIDQDSLKTRLLNKDFCKRIEPFLSKQRYAELTVVSQLNVNADNIEYVIKRERLRLIDSLNTKLNLPGIKFKRNRKSDEINRPNNPYLDTLLQLQNYTYRQVLQGIIDTGFLLGLNYPNLAPYIRLNYNQHWFKLLFTSANDSVEIENNYKHLHQLEKQDPENFVLMYNRLLYGIQKGSLEFYSIFDDLEEAEERLTQALTNEYITQSEYDICLLNCQFQAINETPNDKILKQFNSSFDNIANEFINSNTPDSIIENVALFFIYKRKLEYAYKLLSHHLEKHKCDNENLLVLFAKVSYAHPEEYPLENYANSLIDLKEKINEKRWCEMFVGPCNISFQVFDHEELRNLHCKACAEYSNYAKDLILK